MTESKIQIEQVKVKELLDFANRPGVLQGKTVPISRLRAAAHAANPLADPDDPALLIAMRDNACVGYIGFMPGQLCVDGQMHKIFWYSTWYAPEDSEGLAAGGVLLHASVRLHLDLAATGLDPKTFEYYRRLRFKPVGPLSFYELDFDRLDPLGFPWRVAQVLLRRRGRRSALLDAIFRFKRRLIKRAAYGIGGKAVNQVTGEYNFTEVSELPADARSDEVPKAVEFVRNVEVVRWSLKYPWITDRVDFSTPRYQFSDLREFVRFVVLEVRMSGTTKLLGQIVLSISRDKGITTVKVLDHFLHDCDRYRALLAAGLKYAQSFLADRLHVPGGCRDNVAECGLLRRIFRLRQREYFCLPRRRDSVLEPVLDRISVQYCDGDTPFS